jgi:hypothetical protein
MVQDLPEPRTWEDLRGSKMSKTSARSTSTPRSAGDSTDSTFTEEEICSICLEAFVSADIIRQTDVCTHAFHKHCFEEWIATQCQTNLELCTRTLRCPMCRTNIAQQALKEIKKPPIAYMSL